MIDLDKVRAALPMPDLLGRMGYAEHTKKLCKCPFHDDKTPSFGIFQGEDSRWRFKCHAGCGHGDEIDFIVKARSCDKAAAIKLYAEMAGISSNGQKPAMTKGELTQTLHDTFPNAKPVEPPKCEIELRPLPAKHIKGLAAKRGYPADFVEECSKSGILGVIKRDEGSFLAFPVNNGFHYTKGKGKGWRYTEGATPTLFVLGQIEEGAPVHCFESQWDALAYATLAGERNNIVATRGNQNARLLALTLKGHSGTLYLWKQNDEAGDKWANDIAAMLPDQQLKLAVTPAPHKDMNDWLKAGALPGHVFNAYLDAKDFPVTEPDALVAQAPAPDRATEQGGGENTLAEKPEIASMASDAEGDSIPGSGVAPATGTAPSRQSVPESAEPPPKTTRKGSALSTHSDGRGDGEVATGNSGASGKQPLNNSSTTPLAREQAAPLASTLDQIVSFMQEYVTFKNEASAYVCALWAAHTWVYDKFRHTPYLHIYSPEMRCGKSVLLDCLEQLVQRPWKFANMSEAAIYIRTQDYKPTILWDEIDNVFKDEKENASLLGLLNDGYKRGGKAGRCPKGVYTEYEVYCPKAFCGIGRIPSTTHDRSIDIRMMRAKPKAVFIEEAVEKQALPLKAALEKWAKTFERVEGVQRLPVSSGRTQDFTVPLLEIASSAGEDWHDRAVTALLELCQTVEDVTPTVKLLQDIRVSFLNRDTDRMSTNNLLGDLIDIEDANSPWATWWESDFKRGNTRTPASKLAKMLELHGIKPSNVRMGEDIVKGYYKAHFKDAWERYLPNESTLKQETGELGL